MAAYFSPDFVQYFKDLARNNNRDWFHENKKRYESEVKNPFTAFMADLISEIQKHDASVDVVPKDCIMRINRDIRFSKDKTPYNIHYTGFVSSGGKKNKSIPGIFLRFGPEEAGIMGGCYGLDKDQLLAVRRKISANMKDFEKLYQEKGFSGKYGTIQGEEHKRIPKEFTDAHAQNPILAKKQYYYVAMEDPKLISSPELLEKVMEYWHVARPMNEFLKSAIT